MENSSENGHWPAILAPSVTSTHFGENTPIMQISQAQCRPKYSPKYLPQSIFVIVHDYLSRLSVQVHVCSTCTVQ